MRKLFKEFVHLWHDTQLEFLPISKEILKYNENCLWPDLIAGLNVALLAFPQGMAYAILAGLPVEYGLYGAIIATFISALFSGSRVLNLGPTNSTAVLIMSMFTACGISFNQFPEILPPVLILTGLFLVISSFLNIASLVQYVSRSVIFGYATAVIIIMIVNQLHNILGFELQLAQDSAVTFFDICKATLLGLKNIDLTSVFVAALVFILYRFWKKMLPQSPFIALTILSISLIIFILEYFFNYNFQVLDKVHVSTWKASLKGFNLDNISNFANMALAISFICLIDGATVLKLLAARMGQKAKVNQMIFGMGLANLFCGLCSGMPASSSLVRSSANYSSGARTSLTSLFCGIFCLLGIIFFGPFFNYVPKAGLSMLVIILGINLFEKQSLKIILNTNRSDACVFLITFISAFLFPLNISLYMGILVSIALFMKKAAVPEVSEYNYEQGKFFQTPVGQGIENPELSIIHIEGNLFFASSEFFLDQIREICQRPQLKVIILKLRNAFYIDATCLLALEELLSYMASNNRRLILSEVSKPLFKLLKHSGMLDIIGHDNVFLDDIQNLNYSTAQALKQAQYLIGQENIVVRILRRNVIVPKSKLQASLNSLLEPIKEKIRTIKDSTK